jgi:hypothetical protein
MSAEGEGEQVEYGQVLGREGRRCDCNILYLPFSLFVSIAEQEGRKRNQRKGKEMAYTKERRKTKDERLLDSAGLLPFRICTIENKYHEWNVLYYIILCVSTLRRGCGSEELSRCASGSPP